MGSASFSVKNGEKYHRRNSTRYYEPGTIFKESFWVSVVLDCKIQGGEDPIESRCYNIHLRRLSLEEEIVNEVMLF
jgi:hypothetical protein